MMLDGKIALVTGAAQGTGAAIAQRFVAEGATVVLSDVNPRGAETADALGEHASFVRLDVTDDAQWNEAVEAISARHGGIDVLVNNAAVLHIGGVDTTTPDVFRRVLDVNVTGAYLGARAVVPVMRARGAGSIVNIASLDALVGMNGLSAYAASKWAMRGMSKSLSLELGRDGIRVNTVCPAGGNAAMFAPWADGLATLGADLVHYLGDRALPREASLDEIAQVVTFLASDRASFVTGADVPVDGGHSAGSHLAGFDRM